MEKRKPTHDLEAFKAAFARHRAMTKAAMLSARGLGYERADVARFLTRLTTKDFQKSVTSFGDHRQWQDVYHLKVGGTVLYVKFTNSVMTEFLLLSFKRK